MKDALTKAIEDITEQIRSNAKRIRKLEVANHSIPSDNITLTGTIAAAVSDISGDADVGGDLDVTGSATVGVDLGLTGDADFNGDLALAGSISESVASGCRVYRSTGQTLNSTSWTTISYDTEVHDTDGCWAVGSPTELYVKRNGYYVVGASIAVSTGTTTAFLLGMRISETTTQVRAAHMQSTGLSAVYYLSVATGLMYIAANTYFVINVYNGYSSNLTSSSAAANHHDYNCAWIARIA